ncbi:uncharacterized protein LOC119311502 isoform X3 [Triticum dicoccoides]|uniref:uncharacterized protein LOC119311502 isoform X3 n=1 Tax=Triticum dicoccoides TaxID=85692 RepID=UPI000E7B60D3|nr:uncharacterized protein LOC119311502 isoform X3 [Triticum dicoccoides]
MVAAAAEAGGAGDRQEWQVNEELQAEEEEVNELMEAFAMIDKEPFAVFVKEPFAVFVTYAPPDVRTGTKFNVRTGKKLSPLVVHNSGQYGFKANCKTVNSWRSPRTVPPTELQF